MLAPRTHAAAPASVWPNVVRASLGNLVEWFDWFVYAWFACSPGTSSRPPA
jgi:hypothetical protein